MSPLIKCKRRHLQKLLRYLSQAVNSMFEHLQKSASPQFSGGGSRAGIFLTGFALYLGDLAFDALSTSSTLSL